MHLNVLMIEKSRKYCYMQDCRHSDVVMCFISFPLVSCALLYAQYLYFRGCNMDCIEKIGALSCEWPDLFHTAQILHISKSTWGHMLSALRDFVLKARFMVRLE